MAFENTLIAIKKEGYKVLHQDKDFQKLLVNSFLKKCRLTEKELVKCLYEGEDLELPEPFEDYFLDDICYSLGIDIAGKKLKFQKFQGGDGLDREFIDIVSELGFKFELVDGVYVVNK